MFPLVIKLVKSTFFLNGCICMYTLRLSYLAQCWVVSAAVTGAFVMPNKEKVIGAVWVEDNVLQKRLSDFNFTFI